MIKINLLPQKRGKVRAAAGSRGAVSPASGDGSRQFAIGLGALAASALLVFLAFDRPRRKHIADLESSKNQIQSQIAEKKKQLVGYEEMKKAKVDAEKRAASIDRLMQAKVVPAHVLHELGEILTQNRLPAMTEDMRKKVGNGPGSDPNKRFQLDWDPTKVWLSGFSDKEGVFKLEGGAQSEFDVTQLSKRLAASVYFMDVTPAGGERVVDRDRGLNYYRFTITGRLAY
ncbi:MAG TPA: PilN domain-containing protein [Burkholderiales bacterium]|nr:PilN domain-containing protein [Burkholderiales bacterium]